MLSSQFLRNSCDNKTFKSKKYLSCHTTSVHGNKNKSCPICKKLFSRSHFPQHLQTHLPEGDRVKFKCSFDQCSKEFLSKLGLKGHLTVPRIKLECDQCSKEYFTKGDLRAHAKRIHSGVFKKFECNLCNASFMLKRRRDDHIVGAHTGEKSFQCKECPSKFSSSELLRYHGIHHSDERPHKCEFCSKQFKTRPHLKSHTRAIHARIKTKDFYCPICTNTFTVKSSLNHHIKRHNGQENIPCYFCNKGFGQSSNLEDHLRIHTLEKPFSCSDHSCQLSFFRQTSLSRHRKQRHQPASGATIPIKTCYFCCKVVL